MAVNPNGYIPISDGGAPRIISGFAKEIISGGQFVGGSTATGVVGSGRDSYVTSDIEFVEAPDGTNFIGIALADAASGAELAVATRGTFLVPHSGSGVILAGEHVGCNADSEVIISVAGADFIGRALTAGSGDDYVVFEIGY